MSRPRHRNRQRVRRRDRRDPSVLCTRRLRPSRARAWKRPTAGRLGDPHGAVPPESEGGPSRKSARDRRPGVTTIHADRVGRLEDYYESISVDHDALARSNEDGTLEIDTRLRDAPRALRGPDPGIRRFLPPSNGSSRLTIAEPDRPDTSYIDDVASLVEFDRAVHTERRVEELGGAWASWRAVHGAVLACHSTTGLSTRRRECAQEVRSRRSVPLPLVAPNAASQVSQRWPTSRAARSSAR